MHPVIAKTFGGLSPQYYFRQFFFGVIFPLMIYSVLSQQETVPMPYLMIGLLIVNTLLYPYARFVYEGIVGFIIGENVFLVNTFLMLFVKFMTMTVCWSFAIFIAPVGLLYLYIHHSKNSSERRSQGV
ncbi:MAG: hypothetical protein HEQ39_08340 [Rhizobacter sp.]